MNTDSYLEALKEAEKFTETTSFSYFDKLLVKQAKRKFNHCLSIAQKLKDTAKIKEMTGRIRFLDSCLLGLSY